jgi:hypothetical protein
MGALWVDPMIFFLGTLFTNVLNIFQLVGWLFAFDSFVAHGVSNHGFLILVIIMIVN